MISFLTMSYSQRPLRRFGFIAAVSAVLFVLIWVGLKLALPSQAAVVDDSYITSVTLATGSTTLGATTTYTYTFTNSTTLASGNQLFFNSNSTTGCNATNPDDCTPTFTSATLSGISGNVSDRGRGYINVELTANLAAGSHTVTLSNVTNGSAAAAIRGMVSTSASDESNLLGSSYSQDNWYATISSNAINIGTAVVSGTVTGGGSPLANVHVDVHNTDWSITGGTNTDDKGYYALFQDYAGVAYWQSGSYSVVAYPEEGSGYINTSKTITYSGTTLSQDVALSASEYFFAGTVKYSEHDSSTVSAAAGDPVTNANVCFNAKDGSGSYCDSTDTNGQYTVAVNPGTYTVWLSANVDWNDPEAVAAVDWQYQSNDKAYTISAKGTTTTNFSVEATTATVKGTVTVPNSSDLLDGSIGFTNNDEQYWGSVQDNTFTMNLNPGTFEVWFYPDTHQNADWGKYSHKGTATLVEGKNTYNFTITELTALVNVTVQTDDGAPIGDIQAQAWTADHWTNATTDTNGQASLYIQADTWYQVGIWDDTYLLDGDIQKVNVANGKSTDVSFTVQLPNATVQATITNSDGSVPDELHGWFGCQSKDYSKSYGSNLDNGTVDVGVTVDDATDTFTGTCNVWLPNSDAGVAAAQDVTVKRGETASLNFSLQPLDATVKATVKNFATGKKIDPDSSLNVTLWNDAEKLFHEAKLSDNPVSIPVISNKTYAGGIWSQSSDYLPLWSMNSDTVKVKSGETGTLVLNVLKPDGVLQITVKDPDGKAVDHAWAWCGNWDEVNFALDTAASNAVIDSGGEIHEGSGEVGLVSGHTYHCSVGAPEAFIEQGWLAPSDQVVTFQSKNDTLTPLTFTFKESDATLQGAVSIAKGVETTAVQSAADLDNIWCWAWSEGGSSWSDTEPGEDYRLNVDTAHDQWTAGCDAVLDDTWYFTQEPYQFTPAKGKNAHDFTLQKMDAWKVYEPVNETFDATENKIITYGDGTRLTIPAGTLASSGNVTVRGTPETNIVRTDDHPLTIPVDWEAFDEQNNLIETFPGGDVTIEIPYTDEVLAEFGVDEDSLVGKYWDDLSGSWQTPDNITVDKDNNVITITTDHFTQYGATYNARIGEVETPKVPTVTIRATTDHAVKLVLRTKQSSTRATRFVVQIRKYGSHAKANWQTTTIKNSAEKRRVERSIQKLKAGTKYEVRVKACSGSSCSDPSAWQTFTTS